MIPSDQNISSPWLISAILQYGCLSFCIESESWKTNCYGFSFLQIHWCLLYMVLLVFILHLSQSTLKSVVPLAMLLSSIWRHDNSGWGKCWFLPCLWFGRPGPPFSRADHYIMYIVQNHILSIIIYCTFYKIIYCLWFGRPGRPQPTTWACDTGGRELYYADFDIAPFSRADHYIWYILIQYIFCQADSIYRTSFARLSLCRIPRR